ncbi:sulfatase-like hydrolase/transferase [Serinicoccus sp. CNJ-927]|uniref:sulfatase-like hydrolase/transferase n=1 Tax=Serinicoccus sp. CNJ-927 TaxID=1904970 RepID=UPI0039E18093
MPRTELGDQPNIILPQADQLAPHHVGAHGDDAALTPHLDALAREGAVFDRAYCTTPSCALSRASMLTGRLPSELGCYDNGDDFAATEPTFAHLLRSAGGTSTTGPVRTRRGECTPCLLAACFIHPHDPYEPPPEHWERFDDREIPPPAHPDHRTRHATRTATGRGRCAASTPAHPARRRPVGPAAPTTRPSATSTTWSAASGTGCRRWGWRRTR